MNVLVTGGAGYVGSHIVKKLIVNNYNAIVYDNLSEGHKDAVDKKAVFVKGDLKDAGKLNLVMKKYKISSVMHMAAYVSVSESMSNPEKYYTNNVNCGITLLNAMKKNNIKKIIFSSSSVVYGTKAKMPLTERENTNPENPYGETKLIFENVLKTWDSRHSIKSISLRYFNAAGADPSGDIGEDHDPETHLIPNVLDAALGRKKQVDIFGTDYDTKDGTAVRDYIHVSDIADAHIKSLEALDKGNDTNVYNLGNGSGYSVLDIIKVSEEISGEKISIAVKKRRFGDVPVAIANSSKIKKSLGWFPKYKKIKTIVETAWNWHRKHPDGFRK